MGQQTSRDQLVRRTALDESMRWRFRIGHRFGGGQTSSCLLGGAAAAATTAAGRKTVSCPNGGRLHKSAVLQSCRHRHPEQPGSRSWPALYRGAVRQTAVSVGSVRAKRRRRQGVRQGTPHHPFIPPPSPEPEHHQRHLASTNDVHAVPGQPRSLCGGRSR